MLGLEQKRDAVRNELNRDAMRWLKPAQSLLSSLWHLTGHKAVGYVARSRQRQIETTLP